MAVYVYRFDFQNLTNEPYLSMGGGILEPLANGETFGINACEVYSRNVETIKSLMAEIIVLEEAHSHHPRFFIGEVWKIPENVWKIPENVWKIPENVWNDWCVHGKGVEAEAELLWHCTRTDDIAGKEPVPMQFEAQKMLFTLWERLEDIQFDAVMHMGQAAGSAKDALKLFN